MLVHRRRFEPGWALATVTRVDQVTQDEVIVDGARREQRAGFRAIGGRPRLVRRSRVTFSFGTQAELADLLGRLRDLGVPMSGGVHGWPPSEHFRELRDRGLVSGQFEEVVWSGPNRRAIRWR